MSRLTKELDNVASRLQVGKTIETNVNVSPSVERFDDSLNASQDALDDAMENLQVVAVARVGFKSPERLHDGYE